jgi:hypothetical protein
MDRREAKRRAVWGAANALVGDIQNGWEVGHLTDDYSNEQATMITDALYEVVDELRRRLPEGYVPAPFCQPPSGG